MDPHHPITRFGLTSTGALTASPIWETEVYGRTASIIAFASDTWFLHRHELFYVLKRFGQRGRRRSSLLESLDSLHNGEWL